MPSGCQEQCYLALTQALCPHGSSTNPVSAAESTSGIPRPSGDLVTATYPKERLEELDFLLFFAICLPVGAGFVCGQRGRHTEHSSITENAPFWGRPLTII